MHLTEVHHQHKSEMAEGQKREKMSLSYFFRNLRSGVHFLDERESVSAHESAVNMIRYSLVLLQEKHF